MSRFRKKDDRTEHRYVKERLSAYLDGELSPQEQRAVERHLRTCQTCRWNLRTLRQTVQWTRELPTVPVPRVFTIPAPPQPVRVSRQRWGLPLLQGATALVALLLVFVVAGDVLLTGFQLASAPRPAALQGLPPAAAEVTQVVEVEKEAPVPQTEIRAEKAVPEPTHPPLPEVALPTEPVPMEEAVAPAATPERGGMGAMDLGPPKEEEKKRVVETVAVEAPPAPAAEATETEAYAATDRAEPTPTAPPTPAAPTAVAAAPEPARSAPAERELPEPGIAWLRTAEIVLAGSFVLLATITLVMMLQRHRAG